MSPVEKRVLGAYNGMWADMEKAARTADYRSSALATHTVDPATGQLQRTLLQFHRLGWVVKGHVVTHPTVVSVRPSSNPRHAKIVDCLDETHWLTYDAKTGKLTDNKPGQHHRVHAFVRRTTDGWKVESFTIAGGGSC